MGGASRDTTDTPGMSVPAQAGLRGPRVEVPGKEEVPEVISAHPSVDGDGRHLYLDRGPTKGDLTNTLIQFAEL